jgi:adenylate cyclase
MFKRLLRPTAFKIALLVALAFAVIRWHDQASAAGKTPVLETFEHALGDLRFRERLALGRSDPPTTSILIAEDEKSIRKAGLWPWPRPVYAKLVDQLTKAGAKAIVFDVTFIDSYRLAGSDQNADAALASSIRASGKTVQAFILANEAELGQVSTEDRARQLQRIAKGAVSPPEVQDLENPERFLPLLVPADVLTYEGVEAPLPEIAEAANWFGYFNTLPDRDGTVRFVPPVAHAGKDLYFPSIDLAAVAIACGADSPRLVHPRGPRQESGKIDRIDIDCTQDTLSIPLATSGQFLVNFPVSWQDYPRVSAIDVVDGAPAALAAVAGKVAVVAATAEGTHDIRSTPLDKSVPGGVVHVAAIDQILRGHFLRRPSWAILLELAIVLGVGLGFGVLFSTLPLPWAFGSLLGGIAAYHALSYAFFALGLDLCAALPIAELLVLFPTVLGYRYLTEEREKRNIRLAFRYYLTPSVMDAVLADPSLLKLGGEKRELTVLFSDIRGFTSLSEKLAPEQLVHMLNDYLTPMTDVVFENGGTLDKYMGDAIMAFFGAPVGQPDHALRACRTACQMLEKLAVLNLRWAADGLPPISIGIGLNTGPMVVGNMGSQSRFDYTVMGDAVNLGSRLEGTNKIYGTSAIISEATYAQVKDQVLARELDSVAVKGKDKPVHIFELIGLGKPSATFQAASGPQLIAAYEAALALYRTGRFEEARAAFRKIEAAWPNDGAARHMIHRAEEMLGKPVPEDWDGVSRLHEK